MSSRIETEKKYYCVNNRELLEKIKMLNYKLISVGNEVDEYFTDINSEYIKKRTCLRIRKSNNNMEVTFKGKSKDFSSSFTKLESNFKMNPQNYDNFVNLFSKSILSLFFWKTFFDIAITSSLVVASCCIFSLITFR